MSTENQEPADPNRYIINGAVIAGFITLAWLKIGIFGMVLGYIVALVVFRWIVDLFQQMPMDFFWIRNRILFIMGAGGIGMITTSIMLIGHFFEPEGVMSVVCWFGSWFIGGWIGDRIGYGIAWLLGWTQNKEIRLYAASVFGTFAYDVAKIDGQIFPKAVIEVKKIIRKEIDDLRGAGNIDQTVENIYRLIEMTPRSKEEQDNAVDFLKSFELGKLLILDCLRVVYAQTPVSPKKLKRVEELCDVFNITHDFMGIYNYAYWPAPATSMDETQACATLGLSPGASQSEIQSAFRQAAKQYHPDATVGMPAHLVELATTKMQEINEAYDFLLRNLNRTEKADLHLLFTRPGSEGECFEPIPGQPFRCKCILCETENNIPPNRDNSLARCRECHALLGLPNS